jgi:hypothetical protein
MTGNVHYRVVISPRPGLTECKDILVDGFEVEADGSISEEAVRDALFRQHDIAGVTVDRFYEVRGSGL